MRPWRRSFNPWGPKYGGKKRKMPLRPLVPMLFAFIAGLLASFFSLPGDSALRIVPAALFVVLLILSLLVPAGAKYPLYLFLFFFAGSLLELSNRRSSELVALAEQRARVTLEGTVLEPPIFWEEAARAVVRVDRLHGAEEGKAAGEKIRVAVYKPETALAPGDRILFPARLRAFSNFNNPGRYDYAMAMETRGLSCSASVTEGRRIVPMGKGDLGFPFELLERARKPIRKFFAERLSPGNQALFQALILGEQEGVRPDLRELFTVTGLGHVLSVSGLHVALVAWFCFALIKRGLCLSYELALRIDLRKTTALITCFPVIAYTCLAGFQVPSQRSMMMVLAFLFSMILAREKDVWSTLALAALVVLAVDPHAIFAISFQLSFLAVVGIIWLAPWIFSVISFKTYDIRKGALYRFYVYFCGLASVTISAMLFLLPVTSFYFHRVSLVSLLANMTALPIMGVCILPLGLLAAACLPLSQALADSILAVAAWGLDRMMDYVDYWSRFPWREVQVFRPNFMEILLFYAFLFCLFSLRRLRWARVGLVFVLLILAGDMAFWTYRTQFNPSLKITYLDVGQGNAALIQFPGSERMLIDGGGFPGSDFDVGEMVVAPFLLRSKIRRIDTLVLSHPEADHMGGLLFIADHFEPKEFWYNGEKPESRDFQKLTDLLDAKGVRRRIPADLKDGREISGVRVEIHHPLKGLLSRKSNDNSLVLRISHGETSFLFPGDLEATGEQMLVSRSGSKLKSDVLLVPHHGSKSSCSTAFLEAVSPEACIISSGKDNPFGFPSQEILRRLRGAGCRILRVDEIGAIEVTTGREGFQIKSFR
jgi:competence protein ComEC